MNCEDDRQSRERICIKTPKVYDWLTRSASIELKEKIESKLVNDQISEKFCIPSNANYTVLWSAGAKLKPFGTVTVFFKKGCGEKLNVFINENFVFSLAENESKVMTCSELKSLAVSCNGDYGNCNGRFTIDLHYRKQELCDCDKIKMIKCVLTNAFGMPVKQEAILCEEVPQFNGREDVIITLPNGNEVTLQKVMVVKQGFVVIEFCHGNGTTHYSEPIPFAIVETILMCAPEGTELECDIIDFNCKAVLIPVKSSDSHEVYISIQLCQSIQMVADVKLEIEADFCVPRVEEAVKIVCPVPTIPSACPSVF